MILLLATLLTHTSTHQITLWLYANVTITMLSYQQLSRLDHVVSVVQISWGLFLILIMYSYLHYLHMINFSSSRIQLINHTFQNTILCSSNHNLIYTSHPHLLSHKMFILFNHLFFKVPQ